MACPREPESSYYFLEGGRRFVIISIIVGRVAQITPILNLFFGTEGRGRFISETRP